MNEKPFIDVVKALKTEDPRFDIEAYFFVRDALSFTTSALKRPTDGPQRHVTAAELLDGIRQFAIREYGPMTQSVFKSWGVTRTADFGEIVFNLVKSGKLGKTDEDKKDDFADVYDFDKAFTFPFLPKSAHPENNLSTTTKDKKDR